MKSKTMWIKYLIVGVGMMALMLISTLSRAAITIVGNGDEGTDLEGATPITSGNIFEARQNATALLKRLNVQGIRGLGNLIPELSHTELFLSKKMSPRHLMMPMARSTPICADKSMLARLQGRIPPRASFHRRPRSTRIN